MTTTNLFGPTPASEARTAEIQALLPDATVETIEFFTAISTTVTDLGMPVMQAAKIVRNGGFTVFVGEDCLSVSRPNGRSVR